MKRLGLVALGMGLGFITAVGLLPQAQGANNSSVYKQFDLFSDAYEKVRENYVRPVNDQELMNGAIEGMVAFMPALPRKDPLRTPVAEPREYALSSRTPTRRPADRPA